MNNIHKQGVVILDFGSQYTQLIARRVREQNVHSEILPPETSLDEILNRAPAALILSGGPSSIFGDKAPVFDESILDSVDLLKLPPPMKNLISSPPYVVTIVIQP